MANNIYNYKFKTRAPLFYIMELWLPGACGKVP